VPTVMRWSARPESCVKLDNFTRCFRRSELRGAPGSESVRSRIEKSRGYRDRICILVHSDARSATITKTPCLVLVPEGVLYAQ